MFLAFLQRVCYVSCPGEEGTRDCWGMPKPSKKVALTACLLNPHPTERERRCCWIMASGSYSQASDMSASACGKLHLQVYRR